MKNEEEEKAWEYIYSHLWQAQQDILDGCVQALDDAVTEILEELDEIEKKNKGTRTCPHQAFLQRSK